MVDLAQILRDLGINLSANVIFEFIRSYFQTRQTSTVVEFESSLDSFLQMHGVKIQASTVIGAFAARGLLSIQGSSIYAADRIAIGAGQGAHFLFGDNSTSETAKTKIDAGAGAQIVGSNAAIVQGPDGSIRFYVGGDEGK